MRVEDLHMLPPLSLPPKELKLSEDEDGNLRVFDIIRKKYIALTPEEFVRQNFVLWLIEDLGYPVSMIANETKINLNGTRKRCDTVVYDRNLKPLMIIEYKAPDIEITQSTFDQIIRYNRELKAKYLIVSNGKNNYCCIIDYVSNSYNFIRKIPLYMEAIGLPGIN